MLSGIMETGRIEKGSTSSQQFSYNNIEFESFPFHQEEIKLLPQSEKKHTVKEYKADYRKYCSNCGKRLKYTDSYCSRCGQKA
jgi:hypothetical protein